MASAPSLSSYKFNPYVGFLAGLPQVPAEPYSPPAATLDVPGTEPLTPREAAQIVRTANRNVDLLYEALANIIARESVRGPPTLEQVTRLRGQLAKHQVDCACRDARRARTANRFVDYMERCAARYGRIVELDGADDQLKDAAGVIQLSCILQAGELSRQQEAGADMLPGNIQ